MARMTLEDIAALPKSMLVATDIAPYLECDPGLIHDQAMLDPEKLGFPVVIMKSRVKIPKEGFLNFCRNGRQIVMIQKADGETA
jgi:hypothetical protein